MAIRVGERRSLPANRVGLRTVPGMTETAAAEELAVRVDATSWPTLSSGELVTIVRRARRVDPDGNLISDAGYRFTCDLDWAEMVAWQMKAARAVTAVDFTADGSSMSRSQIGEQCRQMAALAAQRVSG